MTDLIKQRAATHGDFEQGAKIFSDLMKHIERKMIDGHLDNNQYQALAMISAKITRILNGKADFRDHWEDLSNYAILGGRLNSAEEPLEDEEVSLVFKSVK